MEGLVEVPYEYVARYRAIAAREGVSLGPTENTTWWRTTDGEGFGGAIRLSPTKARIKGLFVDPAFRGSGVGRAMTLAIHEHLKASGCLVVDVITARPDVYAPWGFRVVREVRPGSVEMRWEKRS